MAGHDLAGEHEAAGIDFGGAGGIGGAQIMRRDDQPVGAAGPQPRQRHRPPLARAITVRAKRLMISVEMRLR